MNPFGEMRSTTKHSRTPLKINNNGDQTFIDQRNTSYNTPYKFSGKEKDDETNYSYFGARYYHSDISIWLSVDPLAFIYPKTSPYIYCENNTIRYIDRYGLYKDEASANKAREKAVKKYGSDRVDDVFKNEKTGEYGFKVYDKGVSKHVTVTSELDAPTVVKAYKGRSIYNRKDERNYKYYNKTGVYRDCKTKIFGPYDSELKNLGYQLRTLDSELDGFTNESGQAPKPLRNLVETLPLLSQYDVLKTIITGLNIWDEKVSKGERYFAVLQLVPLSKLLGLDELADFILKPTIKEASKTNEKR